MKATGVDQFSRAFDGASKQVDGLERSSGNAQLTVGKLLKTIGLVAAGAAAFRMVRDSVQTAFKRIDTMEQFNRVMTTITGSSDDASRALNATNEAVTGTAYALDVAAAAVQNFVTRGVEVDKATNYIEAWGDAVAFYGDGSNEQFANVTDALAKMVTKGKVNMDQLNRLFDAGIPAVEIYAQATGQSASDVQDALSAGEISAEQFIDTVSEAIMEGTNGVTNIAGAAKEAGASWGAVFGNMRIAVARGVANIIQSLDEMLVNNGLPDMRAMVVSFGSHFESVLNKVAEGIPAAIDKFKELYRAIEPFIPIITQIAILFGGYIAVLASVNTLVKAGAILWGILKAVLISNPIGMVIAALVGLGLALYHAWNTSEEFRDKATAVFEKVRSVVQTVIEFIVSFIQERIAAIVALWDTHGANIISKAREIFNNVLETVRAVIGEVVSFIGERLAVLVAFWQENGAAITEAVRNAFELIRNIIQPVMMFIWDLMQFIWPAIRYLIVSTWELIKGAIDGALNFIMGLVQVFTGLFTGDFSRMWEGVKQMFLGAVQFLWNAVQLYFIGRIVGVVRSFVGLLRGLISNMWSSIRQLFSNSLSAIRNNVQTVKKSIQNIWARVWDAIFSLIRTVLNGIRSFFQSVLGAIQNLARMYFHGYRTLITTVMNAIRTVIQTILNTIRSIFQTVFNTIRTVVQTVLNVIRNVIQSQMNSSRSLITSILNAIRNTFRNIFNALRGIVTNAFSAVRTAVSNGMYRAYKVVTGMFTKFKNAGRKVVTSIADGIKGAIGTVTGAIGSVTQAIRDFLPFSPAKEGALRDIMDIQLAESIAASIDKGRNVAIRAMSGLADAINGEMPTGDIAGQINGIHARSQRQMNYSYQNELAVTKEPAYITVRIGNSEFYAFVDDITNTQNRKAYRSRRTPR